MDNLRFDIEWNANEDELRKSMAESQKAIEGVGQTFDEVEARAGLMISNIETQMEKIDLAKGFSAKSAAIKDAFADLEDIMGSELQKIGHKLLSESELTELSSVLNNVEGDFERIQLVVGTLALKLNEMPELELGERNEIYANLEGIMNFTTELNDLATKVPITSTELKKLKDELIDLELQGKANTDEYRELKAAAVELQTAIANTNTTVKEATSPTPYIDQSIRGIQSLVAAYNVLQGITALLGNENEDLQKGILKITAAMSILQGLQQIQLELRKKDNILITIQTLLQRGYAIAVGQSTGALKLFRLALLATGIGAAVVGIGMLIEYMSKLRDQQQKATERQKSLNEAFESSKSAVTTASNQISAMNLTIKEAQAGLRSKTSTLKEYNDGLGKTFGQAKNLDEAEKLIVKNADKYIEVTYAKARAMAVAELAAKKYAEIIENQVKDADDFITSDLNSEHLSDRSKHYLKREAERRRKDREDELNKDYESYLTLGTKLEKEYMQKLQASGLFYSDAPSKPKNVRSAESALNSIVGSRAGVLERVEEIKKEYARKGMESDEAEIQAVKDKFSKINQVIITENKKITDYNLKNKGKKGFKAVDLIDTTQLKPIEEQAIAEVTYSQETKKLSKEIEEAKKLYLDYEDYKSKLGKEKAEERFKDDLKGFETYLQYITSLSENEADAHTAVTSKTATAGQEERSKLLTKEANEAKRTEEKKYTDLLALMITYDQQRKSLIVDFETSRANLVSTATAEELKEFDRKHVEELNQLDDANIQKLQSVKDLFEGIERMTDAQARKVINDIQVLLNSGANVSPEMLKRIKEALEDVSTSFEDRLPERLMRLSSEFANISQNVSSFNEGLSTTLSILSTILQSTAQIKTGFDDLTKGLEKNKSNKESGNGGGLLGSISAIAGIAGPVGSIVSAVTSVVSSVVGIFKAAKESARKAKEEMRQYQSEVMAGELEYNRILRERAREHANINELTNEQIKLQQKLLGDQKAASQKDFDSLLARLQREGEKITGQKTEKHGGFLGIGKKTRVIDITSGLGGYTYDQLEELSTQNKLTDATRKLFEELKKVKLEVDALTDSSKELQLELLDRMSGSVTASSISSPIIQGFKDGKRAVVDFADSAEEIIQDALLSAMSYTVLEEPLMDLVKQFREDSKDGLNESEIEAFKKGYGDVVKSGLEALKEIEKLTGKPVGVDNGSINGRISRATTEETSSAILGFERARFDLAKQQLNAVLASLDFEKKSHDQVLEQVRYLKAIAQNTEDTVTQLKSAVVELKAINANTNIKVGR